MLAAIVIFAYYVFFFEPDQLIVRTIKLDIGLEEPVKAVFLSDIHTETISEDYLKRVVDTVNRQHPEYVFLGGDYSDGGSGQEKLYTLSDLKAAKGVYAVMGNHDYYYNELACSTQNEGTALGIIEILESSGATVLRNEVVELDGFVLAGIDDKWSCKDDYFGAIDGIDFSRPNILLTHNQEALPYEEYADWDLILAGHTHCGQIRIPPIGSVPKAIGMFGAYDMGHFEPYSDSHVYVSCGLGGGPRMLNPPEITVLELY